MKVIMVFMFLSPPYHTIVYKHFPKNCDSREYEAMAAVAAATVEFIEHRHTKCAKEEKGKQNAPLYCQQQL